MPSSGRFSQAQLAVIDDSVSQIERNEAQKRKLDAAQLAALAAAMQSALGAAGGGGADRELAFRALRFEVANALNESECIAERMMNTAFISQERFPATLEALRVGEISLNHLRVITDEGALIETGDAARDEPLRARYEEEVLEFAREETPNRLRPIAKRLAAANSEAALAARHAEALKCRCVRVVPLDDGMADLVAHLAAEDAYAIRDRILRLTKRAQTEGPAAPSWQESLAGQADSGGSEGDPSLREMIEQGVVPPRSRAEVSADVLRDLLLGVESAETDGQERIQAHVQLVVPTQGAAELVGYGPIDNVTASLIAGASGAWDRVAVDEAGSVISVDRYRPSAEQARYLKARDLHCRAPGCRVPATRCDIDHTLDAALGGETSTANLAYLCRGHHTLKHHTDWHVDQEDEGIIRWTSPTGRVYRDRPPSRVRFRKPRP